MAVQANAFEHLGEGSVWAVEEGVLSCHHDHVQVAQRRQ